MIAYIHFLIFVPYFGAIKGIHVWIFLETQKERRKQLFGNRFRGNWIKDQSFWSNGKFQTKGLIIDTKY